MLIGDMKGRVGNKDIVDVVGKRSVDEVNENSEYLVDTSAARGLFLAKTFFSA